MDQLWLSSTASAIKVWREGSACRWRLNPAAVEWSQGIGADEDTWAALADELLSLLPGASTGTARLGSVGLRWNAIALAPGWLVWLAPDRRSDRSTDGKMASPADQLELAQQFGRVGLYERDLRTGLGRWDAHVFRIFGLDPSSGTPDFHAATQLVHPDERDQMRADNERFIREGGRHEYRFRLLLPDGQVRHVYSLSDVRTAPDGTPAVMVGVLIDDTEAVQQLERQRQRSAKLAAALELASVSVWRYDLDTGTFDFNDVGYALMGLPPATSGLSVEQVRSTIHPEDLPAVLRAAEEARNCNQAIDVVARYRNPDGSWRHLLTRRVAERDPSGRVVAIAGVSIDQTAQVAERERMQALGRSIELITAAAGVGVWSVDLRSGQVEWNEQMRAIYGLTAGQATPTMRHWLGALVHADDRRRLAAERRHALATGAPGFEVDFRIVRPDGEVRWVVCRARQEQRVDAARVTGIHLDVTERRATEAELQRQQERLSMATRAAGAGIWERGLDGRMTYWNDQMYRLRGLDPADPRPVHELGWASIGPEQRAGLMQLSERHISEGVPYERELRVTWPDGSVRWLASVGQVVRDDQGRPLRMTGVNWDITQRKLTETALRDRDAAERASRAKSEFLARMSHELRTPLNAVLGFAQLIERDGGAQLDAVQLERVGRIRTAGAHLLLLIEDVLDLAAIESASLPLVLEPVSLGAVLDDVREWVTPPAERASVALHLLANGQWLRADARRLRQVLANLLTNAVKYNRTGGEVWVTAEPVDSGAAATVCIAVRDSGRGMSADQLAHLFEPFNRLGAEREGIEGAGIGLMIVRHLVQFMGGRIEVHSELGRGTEFRLWLPAAVAAARSSGVPVPAGPPAAAVAATAAAPALDLLYIEDNPVNVMLIEELVALRPSVSLRCAVDGESGLSEVRARPPDVALVDMQLPDIDGFEVLRRVRADPALARLKLIALSANAMPDDVARARRAGFDDYWTKPIEFDRFLAALDTLVAAQRR